MTPRYAKRFKIWAIVVLAVCVTAAGMALLVKNRTEKLAELESRIAALKSEYVPVRFKIENRSDNRIVVKLKLYDMDGAEIGVVRRQMAGETLFVDFASIPVGDRFLAFPKSFFTDVIAPSDGISLYAHYDDDGFPQVFSTHTMDPYLKTALSTLFSKLKRGENGSGAFGSTVHDIKSFKSFDVGVVYRIVARMKGGIEIIPDA